jgi:hypothetical protein
MLTGGVTISDAPGRVAPPVGYVYGGGIDPRGIGRGQVAATFRVTLVVGRSDAPAASAALGDLTLLALSVLQDLNGWQIGEVGPDAIRTIAGAEYLSADVTASSMIDL